MTSLREAFGGGTWSGVASASQNCPSGQKITCRGDDPNMYGCTSNTDGTCNCINPTGKGCKPNPKFDNLCVQGQDFYCIDCPTGTYSCGGSEIPDNLGNYSCGEKSDGWPTRCNSCKAGTRTSASGRTCCNWCPEGEISGGSASWCTPCRNKQIPNANKTACVNPIGNVDDAIRYQRIDHCNGKDWTVTPEQSMLSLNDLSDKNVALATGSTASSYMDRIWFGEYKMAKDTITFSTISKDSDYGGYQQCNQGAGDGGLCDWGCGNPIGSIDIIKNIDIGTPNDQTYVQIYCSCMEACVCYNQGGYYFKADRLTDASGTLPSGTVFLPYDPSIEECETTTCNTE